MSAAQGGKFGAGALSGAFGSAVGTAVGLHGIDSKFWNAATKVGAAGLSGGIGSSVAGGRFIDGVRQGVISGALNHGIHDGLFGENIAAAALTQRVRHLFGPDAVSFGASLASAFGLGAKGEKGALLYKRGKYAGTIEGFDAAAYSLGNPNICADLTLTKLYYSGTVASIGGSKVKGC